MPAESLTRAIARLGAALGFAVTYLPPLSWTTGSRGRVWEPLRRVSSRLLGAHFDGRAGAREITRGEYAGRFDGSLADIETRLLGAGFRRNPLSRLKTRDGEPEVGSWARRPSPLADRQLHLMLFAAEDGVDVYAHEEPSSVNPLLGPAHFNGVSMDVAAGVERTRDLLALETADAPADPPEGHWSRPLGRSRDRAERGLDGR